MEGIVLTVGIALCLIVFGACMIVSGNPRLMHSYHYANVPESELPALARETGGCLVGMGIGMILLVLSDSLLPSWIVVPGVALFTISLVALLLAIVRRNGGLVAFGPRGVGIPRGEAIAAVVVACAVAAPFIGLGVHMLTTGDVSALHDYHREGVAAADLPAFAFVEGACQIVLGIAIPVSVAAGLRVSRQPAPLWAKVLLVLGIVFGIAGFAGLLLAIPAFGGSLMP